MFFKFSHTRAGGLSQLVSCISWVSWIVRLFL